MNNISKKECLARARVLVEQIELADEADAYRVMDEFNSARESAMFQEIGLLTRELHDTLKNFHQDARVTALAEHDIPDIRERLRYVINMSEQAALRTIAAIEQTVPLNESIGDQALALQKEWDRFASNDMETHEFRALTNRLNEYLAQVQISTRQVHANLMDVLVAQEFQDITGQVINRAVSLVQDVETSLVGLIRLSSQSGHVVAPAGRKALEGPQVNTAGKPDVMASQDDVDDLLSSLGF